MLVYKPVLFSQCRPARSHAVRLAQNQTTRPKTASLVAQLSSCKAALSPREDETPEPHKHSCWSTIYPGVLFMEQWYLCAATQPVPLRTHLHKVRTAGARRAHKLSICWSLTLTTSHQPIPPDPQYSLLVEAAPHWHVSNGNCI